MFNAVHPYSFVFWELVNVSCSTRVLWELACVVHPIRKVFLVPISYLPTQTKYGDYTVKSAYKQLVAMSQQDAVLMPGGSGNDS